MITIYRFHAARKRRAVRGNWRTVCRCVCLMSQRAFFLFLFINCILRHVKYWVVGWESSSWWRSAGSSGMVQKSDGVGATVLNGWQTWRGEMQKCWLWGTFKMQSPRLKIVLDVGAERIWKALRLGVLWWLSLAQILLFWKGLERH